jgi:hypothetical protein
MALPIFIVGVACAAVAVAAFFAVALARASARSDEVWEGAPLAAGARRVRFGDARQQRQQAAAGAKLPRTRFSDAVSHAGAAGLALAHATMLGEPSSRTSVGTIRFPVTRPNS